jgi:hypothetical protein
MSPLAFFGWLAETSWSIDLHESQYAYPIIESIHVWALCLFFGTVVMFDLRLLGWIMRSVPVSDVVGRLLPWSIERRALICGSARPALISLLSFSMISAGVFLGAPTPNHALAS